MSELESDVAQFRDAVFQAADEKLAWVTVPIVYYDQGKTCDIRTGVLLGLGTMRFLVTAGHHMRSHSERGQPPYLVMPEKGKPSVPLVKEQFLTTKSEAEDLTVTQLSAETVELLGDQFRYLSLADFLSQHDERQGRGLYLLYGFPNQMGVTDEDGAKRARTWRAITCLYQRDLSLVENYNEEIHILLEYERATKNKEGNHVWPHGMSGCGIWFCGQPATHSPFVADYFKLVGIQTAWHKGIEYAKGTWIDVVAIILWKNYSDARDIMRLHGMEF